MTTYVDLTTMETVSCAACGMLFAAPHAYVNARRADGVAFYCPSGHNNFYRDNYNAQLEKALARERAEHDQTRADRDYQREQKLANERRAIGQKAAKTRLKNRIANGVCPCCKRSFENLHRHMKTQHPAFAKDETK